MDDYKIMDSFDDYDPEKEGLPKKTKLIIIIVASLVFGLSAFLVSYVFLGDKNEEEAPKKSMPKRLGKKTEEAPAEAPAEETAAEETTEKED